MTGTGGLPSYQRFVNGVPVPLFSRRAFRPREKYLILLVFLTFGVVCFGAFFFLPDFRSGTSGAAAVNSVYKVYQHMQKAGPELLIPAPPHADQNNHPNAIPVVRHAEPGRQDIHVIEDKQKLQAKINEEYENQKTLEKPDIIGGESSLQVTSSAAPLISGTNRRREDSLETIPPAHADRLPIVVGGEDKDPVTRQRRDKVKEMKMDPSEVPLSDKEETANPGKTEKKCIIKQTMTALGPIISTVASGMASGYSAVLIPQLRNSTNHNETSINMTDYLNMNQLTVTGTEDESWVAASAALAMIPGCWVAGILMEKFGRRGAYLFISPIFVASWFLVGLAPSMTWLLVGRFLSGLCSGLNGPLSPVFIAETSEPALRGIFLAGISLAIATGVLLSHIFGTWLHWRVAALLCGLFPALCFILCAIAPESPTWLVKRKKPAKARKVWVRLRGEYCEQEFEALQLKSTKTPAIVEGEKDPEKSVEASLSQDDIGGDSSSPEGWKTIITSRSFIIPFLILNVFFFVSQFSGANAVVFYSVNMFEDVAGGENAYVATLVLDLIRVVFSIVACWLTRNYPRRSLTIASGIGTVISLVFLSGSLFMKIGGPWLPICFLFAYMCSISIGLVPLPWLLCGELFSAPVRGLGSGLTSSLAFSFFFIVVKTAPGMMENPGPSGTFAFYGIVVFAGTIFLYFFLPETKGKTLNEIEERFANPKHKNAKKLTISAIENGQS